MTSATKIDDHYGDVSELVRPIFRDKVDYMALLEIVTRRVQAVEDTLWQMHEDRYLWNASGAQQDIYGRIVDIDRAGLSDDIYRRFISAQISAMHSEGTREDLIRTLLALLGGDPLAVIRVIATGRASKQAYIDGVVLDDVTVDAAHHFAVLSSADGVQVVTDAAPDIADDTFTLPQSAYLSGLHIVGVTTLVVDSAAGFPAAGSLILEPGAASEETVTYTAVTPTTFSVSATTQQHPSLAEVQLVGTDGQGFPVVTHSTSVIPVGATSFNVVSTAEFSPYMASTTLLLSPGTPIEEEVGLVTSWGTLYFNLDGPMLPTYSHPIGTEVQFQYNAVGLRLGGKLSVSRGE